MSTYNEEGTSKTVVNCELLMRKKRCHLLLMVLIGIICIAFVLLKNNHGVYYREVQTTVNNASANSNLSLILFSDIHHDPVYEVKPLKETMTNIGTVGKQIHADSIWCLGDMINGHNSTKEQAVGLIQEVIAEEVKTGLPFHNMEGNHDNNIQSSWEGTGGYGSEVVLSPEELKEILEQPGEVHSELRATDYYVDFEDAGIRVICISADYTTFCEETAVWLRNVAFKTDKEVLVLSHCPTRPEWGFNHDIVNGVIIEAELKAFCDTGGTIIAFIHGHDHGDMIETADDMPWTGVAIGCARFQVPAGGTTEGMTYAERNVDDETKVLFDVVCIDKVQREVKFIRFGAGEDRTIRY